jgi:hypothetical protein
MCNHKQGAPRTPALCRCMDARSVGIIQGTRSPHLRIKVVEERHDALIPTQQRGAARDAVRAAPAQRHALYGSCGCDIAAE